MSISFHYFYIPPERGGGENKLKTNERGVQLCSIYSRQALTVVLEHFVGQIGRIGTSEALLLPAELTGCFYLFFEVYCSNYLFFEV